jgi:hypothetical protein
MDTDGGMDKGIAQKLDNECGGKREGLGQDVRGVVLALRHTSFNLSGSVEYTTG